MSAKINKKVTWGVYLAVVLALIVAPLALAAVWTDQEDYSPGSVVTISGDGYWANEMVDILVTAPYGTEAGSAQADAEGAFTWSFTLPADDSAVGDYTYTATGLESGVVQTGTFTDNHGRHNVRFQTSGLTIPTSITITGSRHIPGNHNAQDYTNTFTSPGPSPATSTAAMPSDVAGQNLEFAYSGFPATVTSDTEECTLVGVSPASPLTTGAHQGETTVTATYDCEAVGNNPPDVTLTGDDTANEGDTKNYSFTTNDADAGDTFSLVEATCGANGTKANETFNAATGAGSFDCTFPDGPATSFVSVTVSDGTDSDADSIEVTINNLAPAVTAPADQSSDEGEDKAFDLGSFSDPGVNDNPWSVNVNWGDGSSTDSFNTSSQGSLGSRNHTYADNGTYTVTVGVTDKDGGAGSATFQVSVANVPPTITSLTAPLDPVAVNTVITATVTYSDPGALDTFTVDWAWGDGSANTVQSLPAGSSGSSANHTYTAAGIYTITVTVTDKDGGSDTETFQYVVVYDPSAGFVTGGGWIMSAAGAYKLDESLEGRANFGFVSKYKKGATIPDGQTEFQFKAGSLNFHSSSYEWLVVNQNGTNAQFKGSGTINGAGSYQFMLWAKDTSPDTFRIKIYYMNGDDEVVVYDNGFDQAIAGGSIVIHTGGKK